ncbi:helix-turn-helix transcriptional regulator [Saccharothrix sp.]|uniref:helix-turn-helix domain-containing protein n=1 Tax=Saccharothrix sp. TaxID=1873460 RepID=UPI002811379A|nr:helix-turn-helix transcriptional regulator [Saccharothrix sp.]
MLLYVCDRQSIREIAADLKLTYGIVHRILDKRGLLGLTSRTRHVEPASEHETALLQQLGNAFRGARLACRLSTQQQAAQVTGLSQPTISKIEGGKLLPNLRDVSRLVRCYRIPPAEGHRLIDLATTLHQLRRARHHKHTTGNG